MKLIKPILVFLILFNLCLPLSSATLISYSADDGDSETVADHQARVYVVSGDAAVMHEGEESWIPVAEGDVILEGDSVRTGADAYIEITYDDYQLNTVRVEENTVLEFRSIEETKIYLSQGKLLNQLKGLVKNSNYEVQTPVSVAAVRGTEFFRQFDPDTLEEETSVLDGQVNVVPMDVSGRPDLTQQFEVMPDQKVHFDRTMIEARNFKLAKPMEIPIEQKMKLHQMREESRGRLERFAGGAEKMQEAHSRFEELKQNPEKLQKMQGRMRPREERKMNPQSGNEMQKNAPRSEGLKPGDFQALPPEGKDAQRSLAGSPKMNPQTGFGDQQGTGNSLREKQFVPKRPDANHPDRMPRQQPKNKEKMGYGSFDQSNNPSTNIQRQGPRSSEAGAPQRKTPGRPAAGPGPRRK